MPPHGLLVLPLAAFFPLASFPTSLGLRGPRLTLFEGERVMREGLRFWSVAAPRACDHDGLDDLKNARASQNGQAEDVNRSIPIPPLSRMSIFMNPPKKS